MLSKFYSFIKSEWIEEYFHWILLIPVFYGIGIVIYFSLDYDPNIYFLSICAVLLLGLSIYKYKKQKDISIYSLILSLILGIIITSIQAYYLDAVYINREYKFISIEGTIENIKFTQSGHKIILSDINFPEYMPQEDFVDIKQMKLTSRSKLNGATPGDRIRLKANIVPNITVKIKPGVDYNQVNFFQNIQATGYIVSQIEIINKSPKSAIIENIRNNIQIRLHNLLSEKIGPVAAALLVGETSAIDKQIIEDMRKSGLSHILAVSGLHLSLVVGICFFIIRNILALFPNFSTKYNSKKISAIIAIIASYMYLKISGEHIAATRAFIMSSMVMLAIIIDRSPTPLRLISLAAIIILIKSPESVIHPSFQMSFMAVLALISFYSLYLKYVQSKIEINYSNKWLRYLMIPFSYAAGVSLSSIFAVISTAPFTIYHFNQYANYAILANIFVIPLVSFIIMPLIVFWAFLYIIGLESIISALLDLSISWMLDIAKYVSNIPGSSIKFASIDGISLSLFSLGFVIIALLNSRIRISGSFLILLGFLYNSISSKPYMIILPDEDMKPSNKFAIYDNRNLMISDAKFSKRHKNELKEYYNPDNIIYLSKEETEKLYNDINKLNLNLSISKRKINFTIPIFNLISIPR